MPYVHIQVVTLFRKDKTEFVVDAQKEKEKEKRIKKLAIINIGPRL
jgi:hypothetical protein